MPVSNIRHGTIIINGHTYKTVNRGLGEEIDGNSGPALDVGEAEIGTPGESYRVAITSIQRSFGIDGHWLRIEWIRLRA